MLTSLLRIWLTRSWKPFLFTNDFSQRLDYKRVRNLGLYVHIPFCRKICDFCPYCKVLFHEETAERYFKALIKEIQFVGQKGEKKQVTSLYFGGGTPALMISYLGKLIEELQKYFDIQQGIGVELHPDDITEENMKMLKKYGVTMVSVGIQSFQEKCLHHLGRKSYDYKKIFKILKDMNFQVIDVDFIFAIPGQTAAMLKKDIKQAFTYGATQVSTYPFIDFTFAKNQTRPMGEWSKKRLLESIRKYCDKNQLDRTSVWTFAKPQTKKYSSVTRENFLGFGVSATTLLKHEFKINTFSIDAYIKRIDQGILPTSLTLHFTQRQRAVYHLFWAAYSLQMNSYEFQKEFGISIEKLFGFELWVAKWMRLIKPTPYGYQLTSRGAYYFHLIEQKYTGAYIDKMWNISGKCAFPKKIVLK